MKFTPKGIITPIVTPFDEDGRVNYGVLSQLVEMQIENGVDGIFPLGTSGEFYAISDEEYKNILTTVKEAAKGRVPIFAGANHITTRGVIAQIRLAEEVGVDAISVLTPMFVSQTQDEVYAFYRDIAASTKLPIIIYNNRPKTNVTVEPETVARLADIDNIISVKDSTGDMTNALEYIRLTKDKDFCVLMGRDTLIFSALCSGATGAIASCANIAPRLVCDIYDNYVSGNMEAALKAQFDLAPIRIACGMGSFPAVIKEGLCQIGLPVGKCMDPIKELTEEQKSKLHQILINAGVIK